jgi:trans-2,3-dihydro-3-hydroxyanthranilate isomerase
MAPNSNLFHVDVFASEPLSGNGLSVFLETEGWSTEIMQRLTQEMRQFESIFLSSIDDFGATARVFTVEEELPFAGHPVLGAAAVLHRTRRPNVRSCNWIIRLPLGRIEVRTESRGSSFLCDMDQGVPQFIRAVEGSALEPVMKRLGLTHADLRKTALAQVISTGLPYLIIPVNATGLAKASITGTELEEELKVLSAKFVLILDVDAREVRTWDNLGKTEDIATGSAAGSAGAFLIQIGMCQPETDIVISQGRFVNRPSKLMVRQTAGNRVIVSGEVWPVSHGTLEYRTTSPL